MRSIAILRSGIVSKQCKKTVQKYDQLFLIYSLLHMVMQCTYICMIYVNLYSP